MVFEFISSKNDLYNKGEFIYNNESIISWNIGKDKHSDDIFNLYDFELFIQRLNKDIDCAFYKNKETYFEYKNNVFYIHPRKNEILIELNETSKKDLLSVLQEIYNWAQSVLIENTLLIYNL